MRRITFILMLILFSAMSISAQEETSYRPLAKEGKVWNFLSTLPFHGNERMYYSYIIQGDTTIHGKEYKKLYFRHSNLNIYTAAIRDDGCQAYMIPADSLREYIYYDFEANGTVEMAYGDTAKPYDSPQTFDSNGITLRRLNWTIGPTSLHMLFTWVEGVGATEDFFKAPFLLSYRDDIMRQTGGFGTLVSCFEDGICIYGNEGESLENHFISVPLKYEIKENVDHGRSNIWAEVRNDMIIFYFYDVKDHFTLSETKWGTLCTNLTGTRYVSSEIVSEMTHSLYPNMQRHFKIESDYEVFTLDISTAIHDLAAPEMVNGKSSNGKWYDLSGRRLSVPSASSVPSVLPKGVYIKDGKKVVVK